MWYTIPFLLGVGLLIAGVHFFRQQLQFIRSNEKAIAEVIEIETVEGSDGDMYRPIFRFYTINRKEVIYRSAGASSPAGWAVGDQAQVAYKADEPEKAVIMTYFRAFGLPIVLLALAMPLLVVSGGYYLTQQFLR